MYVIIGQGLAGTTLALRFLERNVPFRIIDNGHESSSSMVAAGLWNPIVFRRVNKTWMADESLEELEDFYPRWERELGGHFYIPKPVWRIHSTKQERDKWDEKKTLPGFAPYLKNPENQFEKFFGFKSEFGEGTVEHCGYLDLPQYLTRARDYLKKKGLFESRALPLDFAVDDLIHKKNFEGVIDARGYKSGLSARWQYLPWGLTKGEVITLYCPDLELEKTFNSGFFLLPLGNKRYRLGATFNWDRTDETPTENAKRELLDKFARFFDTPFEVMEHKAGVRPTVQDRRPMMGRHVKEKEVYLFNGLGTRGVMIAPLLAAHFANWLQGNDMLMKEVDIARFEHLRDQKNPSIDFP